MALIVEDGSGVDGANTFVDDPTFTQYAQETGRELPTDAQAREVLLFAGMDYLRSRETEMKGDRVARQPLPYPREGVRYFGYDLPQDEIPAELQRAQMEAAITANTTELFFSGTVSNVASEKVDVLEVSYFQGGSWQTTRLERADVYLDPLLKAGGRVGVVRV